MTFIDSFLLNLLERACRAFQRLTGRTNVWLALQLTNLSIIIYFIAAVVYFLISDLAPRIFIGVFCSTVLYTLTQTLFKVPIESYENNAFRRVANGMKNPRRVRDLLLRISFLSLVLFYPVLFVVIDQRVDVGLQVPLIGYSLIVMMTVILYLLACDPLPPARVRATEPLRQRVPANQRWRARPQPAGLRSPRQQPPSSDAVHRSQKEAPDSWCIQQGQTRQNPAPRVRAARAA